MEDSSNSSSKTNIRGKHRTKSAATVQLHQLQPPVISLFTTKRKKVAYLRHMLNAADSHLFFQWKKQKKTWQYINPNPNPEPGRWGVEDGSFNEMGTKLWTCYVLEIQKNVWYRLIKNPTTIITNFFFLALLILFGLDAFHRTFN